MSAICILSAILIASLSLCCLLSGKSAGRCTDNFSLSLQEGERYQDEVTVYGTHQSYRIDDREKLFQSMGRQGWHAMDELPKYPNTTEVFIKAVMF